MKIYKCICIVLIMALFPAAATIAARDSQDSHKKVGSDGVRKSAALDAGIIVSVATDIRRVVQKKLRTDNQGILAAASLLSFANPEDNAAAPSSCTAEACHVFGAGMDQARYSKPDPEWLDPSFSDRKRYGEWIFTDSICIAKTGTQDCLGAKSGKQIIALLPWLSQDRCEAMEDKRRPNHIEINSPRGSNSVDQIEPYNGDFDVTLVLTSDTGIRYGCFSEFSGEHRSFHFYYVLYTLP